MKTQLAVLSLLSLAALPQDAEAATKYDIQAQKACNVYSEYGDDDWEPYLNTTCQISASFVVSEAYYGPIDEPPAEDKYDWPGKISLLPEFDISLFIDGVGTFSTTAYPTNPGGPSHEVVMGCYGPDCGGVWFLNHDKMFGFNFSVSEGGNFDLGMAISYWFSHPNANPYFSGFLPDVVSTDNDRVVPPGMNKLHYSGDLGPAEFWLERDWSPDRGWTWTYSTTEIPDEVAPVPLPASGLLLAGLLAIGGLARRRRT